MKSFKKVMEGNVKIDIGSDLNESQDKITNEKLSQQTFIESADSSLSIHQTTNNTQGVTSNIEGYLRKITGMLEQMMPKLDQLEEKSKIMEKEDQKMKKIIQEMKEKIEKLSEMKK
jgi:C4-type Zn-finger protein